MLEKTKIDQIARNIATANLTSGSVKTVSTSSTVDSEGRDALLITIVLTPGSSGTIKSNAALDTLIEIQKNLKNEGEERFPIIEYEEFGEGVN
jgi:outer membrane protein assembly factor BamA